MRDLLNGRFHYQEAGILDRAHLRFFTLTEIDSLSRKPGTDHAVTRLPPSR
jgi:hypothetical protein